MTAEINTHFILVKWVCNTTIEGTISGFNIIEIGEYYKWKSSVEDLNENIIIPISNKSNHTYSSGKAFLNDISCNILDKKERDSFIEFIGDKFGVSRFLNYQTVEVDSVRSPLSELSESIEKIVINGKLPIVEEKKSLKDINWKENRFSQQIKDYIKRDFDKSTEANNSIKGDEEDWEPSH